MSEKRLGAMPDSTSRVAAHQVQQAIYRNDQAINLIQEDHHAWRGKYLCDLLDGGFMCKYKLDRSELAMLLALLRWVDLGCLSEDGNPLVCPSNQVARELVNVDRSGSYLAIKTLIDLGLVRKVAAGGGRLNTTYELLPPIPSLPPVRYSGQVTSSRSARATGQVSPETPDLSLDKDLVVHNYYNSSGAAAADAGAEAAEVIEALKAKGVYPSVIRELTTGAKPVTIEDVEAGWISLKRDGKGLDRPKGAFVTMLRNDNVPDWARREYHDRHRRIQGLPPTSSPKPSSEGSNETALWRHAEAAVKALHADDQSALFDRAYAAACPEVQAFLGEVNAGTTPWLGAVITQFQREHANKQLEASGANQSDA